jgi:hypothetical protein
MRYPSKLLSGLVITVGVVVLVTYAVFRLSAKVGRPFGATHSDGRLFETRKTAPQFDGARLVVTDVEYNAVLLVELVDESYRGTLAPQPKGAEYELLLPGQPIRFEKRRDAVVFARRDGSVVQADAISGAAELIDKKFLTPEVKLEDWWSTTIVAGTTRPVLHR